jgi:hypothetical protein
MIYFRAICLLGFDTPFAMHEFRCGFTSIGDESEHGESLGRSSQGDHDDGHDHERISDRAHSRTPIHTLPHKILPILQNVEAEIRNGQQYTDPAKFSLDGF